MRQVFIAMADVGGQRSGCFFANCVTEMAPHDPEIEALSLRHLNQIEGLLADACRRSGAPVDAAGRARAVMSSAMGAVVMRKAGIKLARLAGLNAQIEPLLPAAED